MMRRHYLFALIALAAGCSKPAATPETDVSISGGLSIKDDLGRTIKFSRPPKRLLSVSPAATEILFAIGVGDRVVAVDRYSDYPDEATKKPKVGGVADPDLESVIAQSPDVVFASRIIGPNLAKALEARHVQVVVLDPKSIKQALTDIRLVGKITGAAAKADEVASKMESDIDAVRKQVAGLPKTKVFVALSPDLYTVGAGTFMNDLLTTAGGDNVAADLGAEWPQMSQETLVMKAPSVVIDNYTLMSEASHPKPIPALTGKLSVSRVVIDQNLVARPGPRVILGLRAVAAALHPNSVAKKG